MSNDEFRCVYCGQTFTKARSDEEAMEETRKEFGPFRVEECEIVCENCFLKFEQWNRKQQAKN